MKKKPCPLCGGDPVILVNSVNPEETLYAVCCSDEHHVVTVWYFDSQDEAIETWNDRSLGWLHDKF